MKVVKAKFYCEKYLVVEDNVNQVYAPDYLEHDELCQELNEISLEEFKELHKDIQDSLGEQLEMDGKIEPWEENEDKNHYIERVKNYLYKGGE